MMIKIIPHDAWNWHCDGPAVGEVKFASTGLRGNDLAAFVKRAGHALARWVRDHPPKPGEVYVHSMNMGATEKFGLNRNADGYSHDMLRDDHRTFKQAHFFRNHKNRNPAESYGLVKESHYDPDVGRVDTITALNATEEAAARNGGLVAERTLQKMASGIDVAVSQSCSIPYDVCFPPGTLVETNLGYSAIETIRVGTQVKTHTGAYREVVGTLNREYRDEVVELDVVGVPGVTVTTSNHPVWVVREEDMRTCHGTVGGRKRRHTIRDGGGVCVTCGMSPVLSPEWVESASVREGDYVAYPIERPGNVNETVDYGYVLGSYIGNGSLVYERRGADRRGPRYLTGVSFSVGNAWPQVIDRLTEALRRITKANVAVYGSGYHADGSRRDAVTVVVHDRTLASQLSADAGTGSKGKRLSIRVFQFVEPARRAVLSGWIDSDGHVNRATGPATGLGRITTTNRVLAMQAQRLLWGVFVPATVVGGTSDSKSYGRGGPIYWVTVPDARRQFGKYSVKVLTGREPKFTCTQFVFGEGRIHLRVRGVVVRRLDSPVIVHNLTVDTDETYVVNNFVVHNCLACGNVARNRSEYCGPEKCAKYGGCRDNLGRVFDDGFHLGVDNPKCRFFDLSDVSDTRGADRTAFITGKVASPGRVPGGAELAEALGLVAPDYLLDPPTLSAVRCLRKLAAHRYPDVATAPSWDDCVAVRGKSAASGPPAFAIAGDDYDRHAAVADLAAAGVVLPPSRWLAAMTGVDPEKCAAPFAGGLDPDRDLLARADAHDLIAAAVAPSDNRLSAVKWAWLAPSARAHAAETAIGVLAAPESPPPAVAKSAAAHPLAAEAKARYLAYQSRALARFDGTPLADRLLDECARHNRGRTV